jgi:hypothetical protein
MSDSQLSRDKGTAYVDMERAEVARKRLLFLDSNVLEVLVAEDNDASLGDEQRKLILLGIAQL